MSENFTPVPIVDGAGHPVFGFYNTVTFNGTVCLVPYLGLLINGSPNSESNPAFVLEVNSGQVVTNTAQIQAGVSLEIAQQVSLNAGVATLNGKVATAANQANEIAALQSIGTQLAGTLSVSSSAAVPTPIALAGTLINPGTVATIVAAGGATAGGFVQNLSPFSINIDEVDSNPTTSPGGSSVEVFPNQTYIIEPTPNAVYANCGGTVVATLAGRTRH